MAEHRCLLFRRVGFGALAVFSSDQIAEAYLNGDLLYSDILVTDVVPAELPQLAGIITLEAVNPASHPAILARANYIPMAFLSDTERQLEILALLDSEIVLSVDEVPGCQIYFFDATSFSSAFRSELLELNAPPELVIQAIDDFGAIVVTDLAGLVAEDIRFVGGKVANFRFLCREYPELSPDALAFTFGLWEEYLDQVLPSGMTLREEIATRLDPVV